MEIKATSNCDLTYEVTIGDVTQTLTYAQMCDLHTEVEKCLEWDKPRAQADINRFFGELDEMVKEGK